MSLDVPPSLQIDGTPFTVGVVAARFNAELVDALLAQVVGKLRAAGVAESRLTVVRVPGSNEVPIAARLLGERVQPDVLIGLGLLIRGGTIHYELIAEASAHALQDVSLALRVPVINGIVVAETRDQAEERCRGAVDRGAEFAASALEMAALKRKLCP